MNGFSFELAEEPARVVPRSPSGRRPAGSGPRGGSSLVEGLLSPPYDSLKIHILSPEEQQECITPRRGGSRRPADSIHVYSAGRHLRRRAGTSRGQSPRDGDRNERRRRPRECPIAFFRQRPENGDYDNQRARLFFYFFFFWKEAFAVRGRTTTRAPKRSRSGWRTGRRPGAGADRPSSRRRGCCGSWRTGCRAA